MVWMSMGSPRNPLQDHSSGHHNGEEGDRRPKLNTEIQGKAIRSSQPDV